MSCYIVNKEHIDLLVWAGAALTDAHSATTLYVGDRSYHAIGDRQEIGQLLWDANRKSVSERYDEPMTRKEYKYKTPARGFGAAEVLLAIRGYLYQTSEHPDLEDTVAFKYLMRLQTDMIHALPEMAEADTWSVSSRTVPISQKHTSN